MVSSGWLLVLARDKGQCVSQNHPALGTPERGEKAQVMVSLGKKKDS